MQDAEGLALALAQEADAGESRVRLEVAGRRQQAQRPLLRIRFLDGIGLPVGNRRHALLGELLGIELQLARRRLEGLALPVVRDVVRLAGKELRRIGLGGGAGRALEQLLGRLARGEGEDPVRHAHALRQCLRDVEVGARFARRLGGLLAPLHPVGAVGTVEIVGFEVARGRQHDVGVARRVGHERVVHDGEQVLAAKPLLHLVHFRAGHGRIVGRDIERAQRRVLHVEEFFAESQVVHHARRRRARGLAHRGVVEIARCGRQQQRAAALHGIVAGDAR